MVLLLKCLYDSQGGLYALHICWQIKCCMLEYCDSSEWVTPAHILTYFSRSHAQPCGTTLGPTLLYIYCSLQFLSYYSIAIALIENFSFCWNQAIQAWFEYQFYY